MVRVFGPYYYADTVTLVVNHLHIKTAAAANTAAETEVLLGQLKRLQNRTAAGAGKGAGAGVTAAGARVAIAFTYV